MSPHRPTLEEREARQEQSAIKTRLKKLKGKFKANLSTEHDPDINNNHQDFFDGLDASYFGKEQESLDPNSDLFKFISKFTHQQKKAWCGLAEKRNQFLEAQQRVKQFRRGQNLEVARVDNK